MEVNIAFCLSGGEENIYTPSGLVIATGHKRCVIGDRGAYLEFTDEQIVQDSIYIPDDCKYRLTDDGTYYNEYRSVDDCYVKVYHQKKTVKYADYKIGLWYISPLELVSEAAYNLAKVLGEGNESL